MATRLVIPPIDGVCFDANEQAYIDAFALVDRFISSLSTNKANKRDKAIREGKASKGDVPTPRFKITQTEFLLRHSTCRNHYLFINAVFEDVRKLFISPCKPLCQILNKSINRQKGYDDFQNRIGELCSSAKDKFSVWNRRVDIDEHTLKLISTVSGMSDSDRKRLIAILNGRGSNLKGAENFDPRTTALLQNKEIQLIHDYELKLEKLCQFASACLELAIEISNVSNPRPPMQNELFESKSLRRKRSVISKEKYDWGTLYDTISEHAAMWSLWEEEQKLYCEEGEFNVKTLIASRSEPNNWDGVRLLIRKIEKTIAQLGMEIEAKFIEYRPKRIYPDVLRIELPLPSSSARIANSEVRFEVIHLHGSPKDNFTVAMPKFGFPWSWYEGPSCRFCNERRADVKHAISALVRAIDAQNVDVLLLPEYFVPHESEEMLTQYAQKNETLVVYGSEARQCPNGDESRLVNQARVLYGKRDFKVDKNYPSQYESRLVPSEGVKVFRDSNIGTFAVCICSDLLEQNVIQAVHDSRIPLHSLFVLSMNPKPDVFVPIAIADAARLYAPVLVSNNCIQLDKSLHDHSSSSGSGFAAPFWKSKTRGTETQFGDYFHFSTTDITISDMPNIIPADQHFAMLFNVPSEAIKAAISNFKGEGLLNPPSSRRVD